MDNNQKSSTPDEKAENIFNAWHSPKDADFVSVEAEVNYRERATMIKDAILFKIPDRVPF